MTPATPGPVQSFCLRLAFRWFKRFMPQNRWGDRMRVLHDFFRDNGRLPTDRMLFNDYLYRLKISDDIRSPERGFTSDKEFGKLFIRAVVGDRYNVPTIAVLRSEAEVRAFDFPDNCAIKATHASAKVKFRQGGEPIDLDELAGWFTFDFYKTSREANYQHLEPKIIVEPFVFGDGPAVNFRVYVYKGEPTVVNITSDREGDMYRIMYTLPDWGEVTATMNKKRREQPFPRPPNLEEIMTVARKLAAPFEFVRIDMYRRDDRFYVGEITHVPDSGKATYIPPESEEYLSNVILRG